MDFEIIVVANKKRKPIITNFLKKIPHTTIFSDDSGLPEGWNLNPTYKGLVIHKHQHIGQWNCLELHKKALESAKKEKVLILEDDARVIDKNWLTLIEYLSENIMSDFDILSIHSREPNRLVWNRKNIEVHYKEETSLYNLFYPKDNFTPRRALGTLAYLTTKSMLSRIKDHMYNGLPIDLFYCNCFNFAFIEPSPFEHDRSFGSLIDLGTYK